MGLRDFLKYPDDLDIVTQCEADGKPVVLSEEDIKILMECTKIREPKYAMAPADIRDETADRIVSQIADQIENLPKGAT